MEGRSATPWEQERYVPVRARGTDDGGGATGHSTVKGKRLLLRCLNKCNFFPCYHTLGWAMRQKTRHLALAQAPSLFSLSYCVGKTINSVNVCLQRLVFNASGATVCRPQCLAERWAGQRTERRVAWTWRRPECNFLSCFGRIVCGKTHCRGKTAMAMQCTASRLETLQNAHVKTP